MTAAVDASPDLSSDPSPESGGDPAPGPGWWTRLVHSPWTLAVGFGLLFTIASWDPINLSPITGLDSSWAVGLAMAFVHHIEWGPNMAFTYGPLGFLSQPTLFFGSTAALAGLFLLVIDVAMFSALLTDPWVDQAA